MFVFASSRALGPPDAYTSCQVVNPRVQCRVLIVFDLVIIRIVIVSDRFGGMVPVPPLRPTVTRNALQANWIREAWGGRTTQGMRDSLPRIPCVVRLLRAVRAPFACNAFGWGVFVRFV